MDLDVPVVLDEAQPPELVHEHIDPGSGCPDHRGQHFLGDLGQDPVRRARLAVTSEQQQRPGQPLLAGVEELVDEVSFDADGPRQHVGQELSRKRWSTVKVSRHVLLLDDDDRGQSHGRGGRHPVWLPDQTALTEEMSAL